MAQSTTTTQKDLRESSTGKKISVLLVAPARPLVGGQAVQAARLVENLRAEENLNVGFLPINPQLPGVLNQLQKIKYLRTVVTSLAYIFNLLTTVAKYDIVHIFSAGDSSFVIAPTPAVLIAKLFGKKTILNYRHGGAESHLQNWKRSAAPIIKRFDKIVVPSNFLVEVFGKFGFAARAIFNFVDTKKYLFRARHPLRPIFLSNRNLDGLYNVGCILRSFKLIQEKFPAAQLIVAGDGEEREKLKNLSEKLNLKNVEFLGSVSPDEMPGLYNRADVYLNSPNVDNMPNSIIEAFACGLPVVSTNAGGIPLIVENNVTGLLIEKNDCEAMARAAIRLLEDDEFAQNIVAQARAECAKYSWDNVREQWLDLYRRLI